MRDGAKPPDVGVRVEVIFELDGKPNEAFRSGQIPPDLPFAELIRSYLRPEHIAKLAEIGPALATWMRGDPKRPTALLADPLGTLFKTGLLVDPNLLLALRRLHDAQRAAIPSTPGVRIDSVTARVADGAGTQPTGPSAAMPPLRPTPPADPGASPLSHVTFGRRG